MSSHFNLKSLTFYGIAITSVLVLFSVTTSYGEKNIKAPRNIGGRYLMEGKNLPGCLNSLPLAVHIEQSGIYLTGSLLRIDANEQTVKTTEQQPPLGGKWDNQQLTLTGSLSHMNDCQGAVAIVGTIDDQTLNGTLRFNNSSEMLSFMAKREEPVEKEPH